MTFEQYAQRNSPQAFIDAETGRLPPVADRTRLRVPTLNGLAQNAADCFARINREQKTVNENLSQLAQNGKLRLDAELDDLKRKLSQKRVELSALDSAPDHLNFRDTGLHTFLSWIVGIFFVLLCGTAIGQHSWMPVIGGVVLVIVWCNVPAIIAAGQKKKDQQTAAQKEELRKEIAALSIEISHRQ